MACENCNKSAVSICGSCYSGHYCSKECQNAAWPLHKKSCAAIKDTTQRNPWYAQEPQVGSAPIEPILLTDEEVALLAITENLGKYLDGIIAIALESPPLPINTLRASKGESLLHIAVISGNTAMVRRLLSLGAYVNCEDWCGNSPLYYACTYDDSGSNGDNTEDEPAIVTPLKLTRADIVDVLIEAGADTMRQGGYSGLRPFEAAKEYGFDTIAERIINSPFHKRRVELRQYINAKHSVIESAGMDISVIKGMVDIIWRAETLHWLIQPNREQTAGNLNPHPGVTAKYLIKVEELYTDLSRRQARWNRIAK